MVDEHIWISETKEFKELESCDFYKKQGYSIHRMDIFATEFYAFIEDFDVGDTVYWFGHDNVYGFLNKEPYTATQEMVDKIGENVGPFMKRECKCKKYDKL